jgi:hypothetical protein
MMDLATFGCSYTYGAELTNPKDAWSYKLGELLGATNTYNYGLRSDSNKSICLKTIYFVEDYLSKNKHLDNELCVIVSFTTWYRMLYCIYKDRGVTGLLNITWPFLSKSDRRTSTSEFHRRPNTSSDAVNITDVNKITLFRNCKIRKTIMHQGDIDASDFARVQIDKYDIYINHFMMRYVWLAIDTILSVKLLKNYLMRKPIKFLFLLADRINNPVTFAREQGFNISSNLAEDMNDLYINEYESFVTFCKDRNYPFGSERHPLEKGHLEYAKYLHKNIVFSEGGK